jgi:3-phosphoshikimate 1-carboxyvinyltransferase
MIVRLFRSRLRGRLPAVTSKSHAHRAMICAALADAATKLEMRRLSEDIRVTAGCINALGGLVSLSEIGSSTVRPIKGSVGSAALDCAESGSTLRFMLPVAASLAGRAYFSGRGRLPERPLEPLIQEMEKHGCSFDAKSLPLTVCGPMTGGSFALPGDISSQFISGILLALPKIGGGEIKVTTPVESKGYIDLTIKTMEQFGVSVDRQDDLYRVTPSACYQSPGHLAIEGDWSNAAVWLAAGAMGVGTTVEGLRRDSAQADSQITALLKASGAGIEAADGRVTVVPTQANTLPDVIDVSDIPDLVPVLTVLALHKIGETQIVNAGRLRIKESDRLASLSGQLGKIGAKIVEMPDGLHITGTGRLLGGEADGCNDHRIVMALALASSLCEGELVIRGADAVAKSYPEFFEDFKALGGRCSQDGFNR